MSSPESGGPKKLDIQLGEAKEPVPEPIAVEDAALAFERYTELLKLVSDLNTPGADLYERVVSLKKKFEADLARIEEELRRSQEQKDA